MSGLSLALPTGAARDSVLCRHQSRCHSRVKTNACPINVRLRATRAAGRPRERAPWGSKAPPAAVLVAVVRDNCATVFAPIRRS